MKMEALFSENILLASIGKTVCWCSNVSKCEIIEAMEHSATSTDG